MGLFGQTPPPTPQVVPPTSPAPQVPVEPPKVISLSPKLFAQRSLLRAKFVKAREEFDKFVSGIVAEDEKIRKQACKDASIPEGACGGYTDDIHILVNSTSKPVK